MFAFTQVKKKNDVEFSRALAGFDFFVNAFACRTAHATHGVTKFLPSFAGELLSTEIDQLTQVMENPPDH